LCLRCNSTAKKHGKKHGKKMNLRWDSPYKGCKPASNDSRKPSITTRFAGAMNGRKMIGQKNSRR